MGKVQAYKCKSSLMIIHVHCHCTYIEIYTGFVNCIQNPTHKILKTRECKLLGDDFQDSYLVIQITMDKIKP